MNELMKVKLEDYIDANWKPGIQHPPLLETLIRDITKKIDELDPA